ncbi:MAG: glycine cleavage system protein GcvH [Candidatus Nanopelagicales bacterium]
MVPEDALYTAEHEWVRETPEGTVVFGITDYAQDALGDIVYVDLPAAGTSISAGAPCGEVESTKSVSELYAPVSGEVVRTNDVLGDAPETVNSDPYGAGWMAEVRPSGGLEGLLSPAEYRALIGEA